MPIYEYSCPSCNHLFEKILSFSKMTEPLNEPCPSCGSNGVVQEITSATIMDPYDLGRVKPSDSFRQRLKTIKRNHPNSTIRDI